MKILVVEDDAALGSFLQKCLIREGHSVTLVADGDSALLRVEGEAPDLMILDLGLPRRDGTEVLSCVQQTNREMSVLVLTGRSAMEERIACLNKGADDFMLKPFSFQELIARCRALQRRRVGTVDMVLRHHDLSMDRVQRKVERSGRPVDLTMKEYALLEHLLLHRNRCVSRKELLTEVWTMSPEAGTNVVDVYVNYLRRKLNGGGLSPPQSMEHCLIETVRGEGYRLRAEKKPVRSVQSDLYPLQMNAEKRKGEREAYATD